jgi:hypothetical protein
MNWKVEESEGDGRNVVSSPRHHGQTDRNTTVLVLLLIG